MVIDPNENVLQKELDRFSQETTDNNFVINTKKTNIMICNNSRKHAFAPEFKVGNSEVLQVKDTLKILGVMIQANLKWEAQVEQMSRKASKKIWLLR